MVDAQQLVRRLQRRGSAGLRTSVAQASHMVWELAASSTTTPDLHSALVYSRELPSMVPPSDPIFADPSMPADSMSPRRQTVYRLRGPAYIEPRYGYTIAAPYKLVDEAFARAELLHDPDLVMYYPGTPSLTNLMRAKRGKLLLHKERAVISLRGGFDDNIYHILSDVLPRLALFDEHGIDRTIPVVISSSPLLRQVVQALEGHGDTMKRRWLVQDNAYIQTDEVIFGRADDGTHAQIEAVIGPARRAALAAGLGEHKLFVTRAASTGRTLQNAEEIELIARRFGYDVVDPALMPVEEQIAAFSRARAVVGLHGAGLTNIVYRGHSPLHLLEIMPPYRIPSCFYAITRKYGFVYDYIVGSGTPSNKLGMRYDYYLSPASFEAKLERLEARLD